MAHALGISFIDLDWYIEERTHKTIPQLFNELGEAGFRKRERDLLHEAGEFEDVVISTGGGTPCFFDNMDYMNRQGDTVFLDAQIETLYKRLKIAKHQRPILQGKKEEELKDFITTALKKRMPFYNQARYTFCADNLESHAQITGSVAQLQSLLHL